VQHDTGHSKIQDKGIVTAVVGPGRLGSKRDPSAEALMRVSMKDCRSSIANLLAAIDRGRSTCATSDRTAVLYSGYVELEELLYAFVLALREHLREQPSSSGE
jgi:hypothetical protein